MVKWELPDSQWFPWNLKYLILAWQEDKSEIEIGDEQVIFVKEPRLRIISFQKENINILCLISQSFYGYRCESQNYIFSQFMSLLLKY